MRSAVEDIEGVGAAGTRQSQNPGVRSMSRESRVPYSDLFPAKPAFVGQRGTTSVWCSRTGEQVVARCEDVVRIEPAFRLAELGPGRSEVPLPIALCHGEGADRIRRSPRSEDPVVDGTVRLYQPAGFGGVGVGGYAYQVEGVAQLVLGEPEQGGPDRVLPTLPGRRSGTSIHQASAAPHPVRLRTACRRRAAARQPAEFAGPGRTAGTGAPSSVPSRAGALRG